MTVRGERTYRLLLRAYPRSFRQRFEPEMIELFAARRAAVGRGWRARTGFWRSLLNDLARSAFRERFPPVTRQSRLFPWAHSHTTCARQRFQEIGIRMALGAQHLDIRRLIVGSGLMLTVTGVLIGIAGAYALGRYASSLLYEVTPADPMTYATLVAIVLASATLASWLPAGRALRVDPVRVLRSE